MAEFRFRLIIEENRRLIAWVIVWAAIIWLFVVAKEVMTLLLVSYAIAILIDPLVVRLERNGIPRSRGIFLIGFVHLGALLAFVLFAIPILIREYSHLVSVLPEYLANAAQRLTGFASEHFGVTLPVKSDEIWSNARDYLAAVDVEQLKIVGQRIAETVLSGYSVTLTFLNLTLLPFFVFYISADLNTLHRLIGRYVDDDIEQRLKEITVEVLKHVYAFAQGQLTVSAIMAVLYALGLWLVGLPSGVVVGLVAGLFNFVPYLGIAFGVSIATIIALVTGLTVWQIMLIWAVFGVVQLVEGMFLTPKIVGESVGLHPLGVMIALIIGGNVLGLMGLVIAIPAAAAAKVLVVRLLAAELLSSDDRERLQRDTEADVAADEAEVT